MSVELEEFRGFFRWGLGVGFSVVVVLGYGDLRFLRTSML